MQDLFDEVYAEWKKNMDISEDMVIRGEKELGEEVD